MAVIIDWLKSGSLEEAGLLAAEIVRFNQYVVSGFLENSMNMSENQTWLKYKKIIKKYELTVVYLFDRI